VLAALAIATVLLAPPLIFRAEIARFFDDPTPALDAIRNAGPGGPAVLIALSALQTVVAPIPSQVTNIAAGVLFGVPRGILYSWVGMIIGTTLAMMIARYLGRPVVEKLIGAGNLAVLDRMASGAGLGFFFVVFLMPGLPDDALCLVAGLTPLPIARLVAVAAIARLPGMAVSVWFGAQAVGMPWQGWVGLALLGIPVAWLAMRYGQRLQTLILARLARRDPRREQI
jgi:uncharacterized membrane protein YdjX (TVP38/TMEM64 family)